MAFITWCWQVRVVRYLVAGASGATVHIGTVYVLTHVLGWWHLIATSIGFLAAFLVSFTLQKFLTFQDRALSRLPTQGAWYGAVALTNFFLNGTLMYVFVDVLGFWPVLGQVSTSLLLAVEAYFAYALIFSARRTRVSSDAGEQES